jgi:hypothetical protein
MLLRSFSAPILNSWLPQYCQDSSPEAEPVLQLSRTRSVCLTTSFHPHPPDESTKKATQALSEADFLTPPKPKKTNPISLSHKKQPKITVKEEEEEEELKPNSELSSSSIRRLFSSSGLGERVVDDEGYAVGKNDCVLQTLVGGGGTGSIGGGCGGRGSDGGDGSDNGGSGSFEGNNHGRDNTDTYYQKMIEANPGNALFLGNYAKFLKEVINKKFANFLKS